MTQQRQRFKLPNGDIVLWTLNEFLDWLVLRGQIVINKSTGFPVQLKDLD